MSNLKVLIASQSFSIYKNIDKTYGGQCYLPADVGG